MGYASSPAASSRRTNVIGLIIPDVGAAFSLKILKEVNAATTALDVVVQRGVVQLLVDPSSANLPLDAVSAIVGPKTNTRHDKVFFSEVQVK